MLVVTGATGFIGSAMVWELNQAGHNNIIGTDTIGLKDRPKHLKDLEYKSFYTTSEFLKLIQGKELPEIEGIFHMGACSSTSEMDREFLRINNTEYTRHLMDFCCDQEIPYIYASSASVYGDGALGFNDRDPASKFTPMHPYGESKLNFDKWVEKQDKLAARWYGLRFFNVFGPNEYHKDEMCSVVYKAFLQINETRKLKLFKSHHADYNNGEQMRDFVYVKDITRWMLEIYKNRSVKSGIYNMGFGQARTWLDLAKSVFSNMEKDFEIDWIDIPDHLRDQYQYFTEASMEKLFEQGISRPQWSLEEGVTDYLQNYLLTDKPFLN